MCYRVTVNGRTFIVLLRHVNSKEDQRENEAQRSDHDITDGQEVVLAAKKISSWNNESFVTREAGSVVVVRNLQLVVALGEILIDHAVKFSEVGKTGSTHPHDEML